MCVVNIRSIQHFMYCPRRWGLLEINNDWAENVYVIKANLIHEKVHSGEHDYSSKSKKVCSSVAVYNDELDIYGIVDCVEFVKNSSGAFIQELNDNYNIRIIEYKPTKPKKEEFLPTDAIQVFAQKLCLDFIFKCDSEAYLYYADVRRRVKLPFQERHNEYYNQLTGYLCEIRNYLAKHNVPPIKKGQNCNGCSLSDICIPKCSKSDVRKQIMSLLEDV